MSVYVDGLQVSVAQEAQARRVGARNGHRWCHLLADTVEELHAFAARIGMRREWFQPESTPHYDLTPGRRARSVDLGAVEIDRRQVVALIRAHRAAARAHGPWTAPARAEQDGKRPG